MPRSEKYYILIKIRCVGKVLEQERDTGFITSVNSSGMRVDA